jgi:chromosomal replication initiation ATPase DnaA
MFDAWFGKLIFIGISDGVVTLGAPTKFIAKWVQENYSGHLFEALEFPNDVRVRCFARSPQ